MYLRYMYGGSRVRMVDYTAAGTDIIAKTPIVAGNGILIVHEGIPANKLGAAALDGGTYEGPKAAGVIAAFADVYWDDTAKVVTTNANAGANKRLGIASAYGAATGDTTVVFHHIRV